MNLRPLLAASAVLAGLLLPGADARAAACNVTACFTQIQAASGLVVNDVFHDANNNTGDHLPLYGKIVNNWPGCPEHVDFAGAGHSISPFDCPGEYSTDPTAPLVVNANSYLGAVDRQWWQPCRLNNGAVTNGCVADWSCIADGTGGNYNPWEGLVFDLGGPSNKVAVFAENDHGPQPCESLEYTVFLSDNPTAQAEVLHPEIDGVDPMKWNRAVLSKIYTGGWVQVRPPDPAGHASCGDTAAYSVEEDSFVQVFSLPCGITFRYAAVVAGNDGLDFPACAYDSNEGEIDAVAGLTENGAAVCPDADGDHYVDCNCPTAPPVCDCNDKDPAVHPGAPEACDSPDLNCDGVPGSCQSGFVCYLSTCLTTCSGGENPFCPAGSSCQATGTDHICVPNDCNCTVGQVCINNVCVDACANVHCPGAQVCQDGNCFDPCANVLCPAGQLCQGGACVSPCNCFAGDIGCTNGTTCDNGMGGSDTCVAPTCKGVECAVGQTCDPTTGTCVDFCGAGVQCPEGQHCVAPGGCVPLCMGVTCTGKSVCDPSSGNCVDTSCMGVTCFAPQVCVEGTCVTPDGGGAGGGGVGGGGNAGGSGGHGGTASGSTGTHATSSSGSGGSAVGDKGKCGCRIVGEPEEAPLPGAGALALLGLAAATARRRASKKA